MKPIIYLLQASLLLAGLFAAYWFLLRKETFFQLNRVVLVSIALTALLLPLVPMPDLFPKQTIKPPAVSTWIGNMEQKQATSPIGVGSQAAANPEQVATTSPAPVSLSILHLLALIYWAGVLFLLVRLLLQSVLLARLVISGRCTKSDKLILVETVEPVKPFSFFHFIVYNPSTIEGGAMRQIVAHEQIHCQQWHTLDILLGELCCIVLWFHPFAWKLAQQIRLNLEYLADRSILQKGFERKSYQYNLLRVALNGKNLRLTNNFNQSLIKKRIIMMNAKQSPDSAKWKYFLLLPLLFGIVFTLNQANAQQAVDTTKAKSTVGVGQTQSATSVGTVQSASGSSGSVSQSSSGSNAVGISSGQSQTTQGTGSATTVIGTNNGQNGAILGTENGGPATVLGTQGYGATDGSTTDLFGPDTDNHFFIVRKNTDKATLERMQESIAKAGIQVDIPELEYSADGMITRIKLDVKSDKGINGNVYSDNDSGPIEGPVGFYLVYRKDKHHFGTIMGEPDNLRLPQRMIDLIKGASGYFKGDVGREE